MQANCAEVASKVMRYLIPENEIRSVDHTSSYLFWTSVNLNIILESRHHAENSFHFGQNYFRNFSIQLEKIANENPTSVSNEELLEKLKCTEHQLEHWQSLKRKGKISMELKRYFMRTPGILKGVCKVHVATLCFHADKTPEKKVRNFK